MLRASSRAACLLAVALVSGCSAMFPRVEVAETAPVVPVVEPPPPANGAIFQSASYRPLFEDYRARLVGDTLTVMIVEKVNASQKSTSSIDKGGNLSAAVTALPGVRPADFARAAAAGSSSNTFAGKGATESSNDFSGTITVVVRQVLPNGHLLVAGEKQIGINSNVDVLKFSGTIDPRHIRPGNVVPSTQVANARIESRNRGAYDASVSIARDSRVPRASCQSPVRSAYDANW